MKFLKIIAVNYRSSVSLLVSAQAFKKNLGDKVRVVSMSKVASTGMVRIKYKE